MSRSTARPRACAHSCTVVYAASTNENRRAAGRQAFALLAVAGPATASSLQQKKLSARGIDPATAGERSGLFTKFDARLVHAALRAGGLAAVYCRLGKFYSQRPLQMSAIRSRLLMPLLVLLLALRLLPLPALIGGTISSGAYLAHTAAPHRVGCFFTLRWLWKFALDQSADSLQPTRFLRCPLFGRLMMRRSPRGFLKAWRYCWKRACRCLMPFPLRWRRWKSARSGAILPGSRRALKKALYWQVRWRILPARGIKTIVTTWLNVSLPASPAARCRQC